MSSIIPQQTVKQLKVIQEKVLSEASKLNEFSKKQKISYNSPEKRLWKKKNRFKKKKQ